MQPATESIPMRIRREAMAMPMRDVTRFLQEVLSVRLTAYLAGLNEGKPIRDLAKGEAGVHLDEAVEERMRSAYYIVQLLLIQDSSGTIKSWFIGMNPELDDESPAQTIRDGNLKDAELAAHAFFVNG